MDSLDTLGCDRPVITLFMERAGVSALDDALGILAPHQVVAAVYTAMVSAQCPAKVVRAHLGEGQTSQM